MRITVVGTGYVGLVVGACLAETGNDVHCADLDVAKIEGLKRNVLPIYEPGLDELVERNQSQGRLRFTTDVPGAIGGAEVVFIAVGTPPDEDGSADLRHVLAVAELVGKHMTREVVVVTKSTVPVGTADKVEVAVAKHAKFPFHLCSNPEFLKEGAAVDDFLKPDRVVLGVANDHARSVMAELYAPFVRTGKPIIFMDIPSAEMTKYAANAMLATRISFMNEVANLCEKVGADVDSVRKAMGSDERIGQKFLFPGCGYGGSCFPKDVKALIATARNNGLDFTLLSAVDAVNDRQKRVLAQKAKAHFGTGNLRGKKFGVWGLAFKPKTDDLRQAPSIALIEELLAEGATVVAHDPVANDHAQKLLGGRVSLVSNPYAAVEGADALFLVTEWNEFRQPDFGRMKSAMREPVLIDGRNIWNPRRVRDLGFTYYGIGRSAAVTAPVPDRRR